MGQNRPTAGLPAEPDPIRDVAGGRRLEACKELEIEPARRQWGEGDPTSWIVSANLHRRHMNTSQRAALGADLRDHFAKLAKARQSEGGKKAAPGRPAKKGSPDLGEVTAEAPSKSAEEAAAVVGVGRGTVEQAAAVKTADPALFAAVKTGLVTVDRAYKQVKDKEAEQGAVSAAVREATEGDGKLARARFKAQLSKGIVAAGRLFRLDPELAADLEGPKAERTTPEPPTTIEPAVEPTARPWWRRMWAAGGT